MDVEETPGTESRTYNATRKDMIMASKNSRYRIMADTDDQGNIGIEISQARLRANHIMASLPESSQFYLQAQAYRAKIAYYSDRLQEHMRLHQYHEAMRVKSVLRQFVRKLEGLYNSPVVQNKL